MNKSINQSIKINLDSSDLIEKKAKSGCNFMAVLKTAQAIKIFKKVTKKEIEAQNNLPEIFRLKTIEEEKKI